MLILVDAFRHELAPWRIVQHSNASAHQTNSSDKAHITSLHQKKRRQQPAPKPVHPVSGRRTLFIKNARGQPHQASGGCGIPGTFGILRQSDKPVAYHEGTWRHVVTGGIDNSGNGHFNNPRGYFPTTKNCGTGSTAETVSAPTPSEHPGDYQKVKSVWIKHIPSTPRQAPGPAHAARPTAPPTPPTFPAPPPPTPPTPPRTPPPTPHSSDAPLVRNCA